MIRLFAVVLAVCALVAAFVIGAERGARVPPTPAPPAEMASVVRAALTEPDPLARMAALAPVLRALRPDNAKEVVEAYEAAFESIGPSPAALALLAEAWASIDPDGAFERIKHWPEAQRADALPPLLRAWGRRAPFAALAAAEEVVPYSLEFASAAFDGWAESADPEMWIHVTNMGQSMERERASISLMQQIIARGGFDALFAQVENLPDDAPARFKLAAFGTAASLVAQHDPQRALEFADKHAAGPFAKGLLNRVAKRWVMRDAPAALQALIERPAGVERDWALREAYLRWLRRDRTAAMAWMPDTAATDSRFLPLLVSYARALANNNPQRRPETMAHAIAWTETIADRTTRRDALLELGVMWHHQDPGAARPWIQRHELTTAVARESDRRQRLFGALAPAEARNSEKGPPAELE